MSTIAVAVKEERVIHNTATVNDGLGGLTERSARKSEGHESISQLSWP
jgi:hypothetical protein